MFSSKDLFFAPTATTGYRIAKSLRFRSSASAYLSRTPGTAGNRKTFTLSAWIKRGLLSAEQGVFYRVSNTGTDTDSFAVTLLAADTLSISGYATNYRITTQVFRDTSAWYHIVVAVDTTQATANNRIRVYVNGAEVTAFGTTNNPTQNADTGVNSTAQHSIGSEQPYTSSREFDGYMADVYLIDGQALTPSSFGETDATTGVWKPKAYTGTYGTNGFYLKFTDVGATSGSNTGYGKDFAGTNYWTTNNLSSTAGTTYDSMWDTPTPYDDGGNGVGNYCTLNPLRNSGAASGTFSNANLQLSGTSGAVNAYGSGSQAISGKMYFEITATTIGTASSGGIGIVPVASSQTTTANTMSTGIYYIASGNKRVTGTSSAYGSSYTNGDVIGVAVDATAETVTFYKNNVSQGSISGTGVIASGVLPYIGFDDVNSPVFVANFGQRPFAYTPPSGFKAINTQNLPTPTIANGAQYMAATTYTGNGSTQTISNSINGVSFQPDFLWLKSRSSARNHRNMDVVRGFNNVLSADLTQAEYAGSAVSGVTSSGFSLQNADNYNVSSETYISWQWKANGSGSSNTSGSITSTVSANATAGFSVVTYQIPTSGTSFTIGHGLGVAPSMIIQKTRSTTSNWQVYHSSLGATNGIWLNLTNASGAQSWWNNTAPTSTLFSINNSLQGASAVDTVAYCFAAVAGYSAFGSYTANGVSGDGNFIYLGFRPRFILYKRTDASSSWFIQDTARQNYNVQGPELYPESSAAESTATRLDILSNGFKIRATGGSNPNVSGATYIYAAFAENPFSKALAF